MRRATGILGAVVLLSGCSLLFDPDGLLSGTIDGGRDGGAGADSAPPDSALPDSGVIGRCEPV